MRFGNMPKILLAAGLMNFLNGREPLPPQQYKKPIENKIQQISEPKEDREISTTKEYNTDLEIFDEVIKDLKTNNYYGHINDTVNRSKYYFLDSKKERVANHGLLVSEKDSNLTKLVNKLTKGIQNTDSISQRLLNFVTNEISYSSDSTLDYDDDSLRTAYKIIRDRKSDCSGKTILYASLLVQKDIDFFLVYYPGHINVAVAGKFPNLNDIYFNIGEKHYYTAEPTIKDFRIGRTHIYKAHPFTDIEQLQRPGKNSRPYDMHIHKNLKLRKE